MKDRHLSGLNKSRAVILCGGKGSRLGTLTRNIPKPLLKVHGRPLLWYLVLTLLKYGFRYLLFPVGYKGDLIQEFLHKEFDGLDISIECVDTGENASIADRLLKIADRIPSGSDFFLVNGDTYFNFDISDMYNFHLKQDALLTMSSVQFYSQYGLIIEDENGLASFSRDERFCHMALDEKRKGFVNAGLVWLKKEALELIDKNAPGNFEHDLYPKIIAQGRAAHYHIDGDWFAVDTPKDLAILNGVMEDSHLRVGDVVKKAQNELLVSRYSYSVCYVPDDKEFWKSVLNKTVIPHQVELQPGPDAGKNLCWLNCP